MIDRLSLPSPYRLVERVCVDSTNAEAKRLMEAGALDRTVVWAKRQTAGRGRRGRIWVSVDGNLYFSIVLRPPEPLKKAAQLSFVAANAVADVLSTILPPGADVTVKWPNDILVADKKISGILMEGEAEPNTGHLTGLVVGVGLNVAGHPSQGDIHTPATSLAGEGVMGPGLDVQALLDQIVKAFLAGLETWQGLGFAPVRLDWLQRAKGLGGPVRVQLMKETVYGTFSALGEDGALILHQDGKPERRITAGDVFILKD